MSTIKKLLGKRIREIRKSKGITQEQFAELIGIGTPNVSYIETGKFAPSMEHFEKMVEIFGIEPYELYMFSPLKNKDEIKEELFSALEKDEDLLRLVYKFFLSVR